MKQSMEEESREAARARRKTRRRTNSDLLAVGKMIGSSFLFLPSRTSLGLRAFASLFFITVFTASGVTRAQEPPTDPVPPKLEQAVERGLTFLSKQQEGDGAIAGGGPRVAVTSLALMGYLAAGHVPDLGRHGAAVRAATDYLIAVAPADGYFGKVDGSRMYGHGITALALAEVAGVEPDPVKRRKILSTLSAAVRVILEAQDVNKNAGDRGGWRYEPGSVDSDLSLSGWNALALRAAQNVGVQVPKDRVQRAVEYVLRCYQKEQKAFGYQPGQAVSAAMTGVGVLNLFLLDASARPEMNASGEYLEKTLVNAETRFPYYSAYYATQAASQIGGGTWDVVWAATMDRMLAAQMEDGGWPVSKTGEEPGRAYATSMAVLTLTVPYRVLPIYQR